MNQPAIASVDLGRLHESLLHVRVPRREPPKNQQLDEQIDASRRRSNVDAEPTCEGCDVEHPVLLVRTHRPQPTKRLRGQTGSERGDVAFEVGPDEVPPPPNTRCVVACEEALGESTTNPQHVEVIDTGLSELQRCELEIGDPTRERLSYLVEDLQTRGPKKYVETSLAPVAPCAIDQTSQYGREAREPMYFVENDERTEVRSQERLRIGQSSEVRGGFEIEIEARARRVEFECERRLSHLPRSEQGDQCGVFERIQRPGRE